VTVVPVSIMNAPHSTTTVGMIKAQRLDISGWRSRTIFMYNAAGKMYTINAPNREPLKLNSVLISGTIVPIATIGGTRQKVYVTACQAVRSGPAAAKHRLCTERRKALKMRGNVMAKWKDSAVRPMVAEASVPEA
jgi:hypothetical protein